MTEVGEGQGRRDGQAREIGATFRELAMTGVCPDCEAATWPTIWSASRHSPACMNSPSRVKCATLAWHTLNAALEGEEGGEQ